MNKRKALLVVLVLILFRLYVSVNDMASDDYTKKEKFVFESNAKHEFQRKKGEPNSKRFNGPDGGDIPTTKTILFWGTFYNGATFEDYCIHNNNTMDFCRYKCKYTINPKDFDSSDAIVIHGRESNDMKLPTYRIPNQYWVFVMYESPKHSFTDISKWNHIFNWTMSYRKDSDVFIPYGIVVPRRKGEAIDNQYYYELLTSFGTKKMAAWAVSNCFIDSSKRNDLMKQIQKYLPVDVHGYCGQFKCVVDQGEPSQQCEIPSQCHQYLGSRYKFYFAFENSLCKEYITEKVFNCLKYGMIPIVYGPAREDYLNLLPDGSFIHVDDFTSVESLAKYLLHLSTNFTAYANYFAWRNLYKIDDAKYYPRSWCTLCEKLHTDNKPKTYSSVLEWWHFGSGGEKELDMCKQPYSEGATVENLYRHFDHNIA